MNLSDLMKQFEIRKSSERMVNQAMVMLNPDFKKIDDDNVTVDEFLETLQKSQADEQSSSEERVEPMSDEDLLTIAGIDPASPKAPIILSEIKKQMSKDQSGSSDSQQQLILNQSRKQFSTIIGQPLTGQEAIADVFSGFIEKSIWSYAQPKTNENSSSSTIAFVLSLLIFLSVVSIGSIAKIVWIFAVKLYFFILTRMHLVRVKKLSIEQEVIE
jgi:hypothetical protein